MTIGIVEDIGNYPLKGARRERPDFLSISSTVGVVNDRRFGIRRTPGNMEVWAKKPNFFVCMNTPRMAIERPVFEVSSARDPGSILRLDPRYTSGLATRLGIEGELQIQDTHGRYSLADTEGATVSFLNLASVRALSEFAGTYISPERFRMNIWMEGLDPFEELTWVDTFQGNKLVRVGNCVFRIDDACERCLAIETNPETGVRDIKLVAILNDMMKARGYKSPQRGVALVMGVLGVPMYEQAQISRGDQVVFLG
jgi:uncharacterized protein YcbX